MEQHQQQRDEIDSSISSAQFSKLKLEIENLEKQNKWSIVAMFVPVITTVAAVLGLVVSVWQIQRAATLTLQAQENERTNKIQSQIRADKEQLLEFITNDKISSVRAAFLIDDLSSLIAQLPKGEAESEAVTELLRRVAWKLSFDRDGHFDFDVSALRRWKDYRQFWKSNLDSHHDFLTSKYYPRLKQIHGQNPSCIENLDYEEGTLILTYRNATQGCQEELINALLYGFKEHLELLRETKKSELLRKELEVFSRLTNKSQFASRLSAIYFPQR